MGETAEIGHHDSYLFAFPATKARKTLCDCLKDGVEARFPKLAQLPLERATITALGEIMGRAQVFGGGGVVKRVMSHSCLLSVTRKIIVARRDMDMASVDVEALVHSCEETSFVKEVGSGLR